MVITIVTGNGFPSTYANVIHIISYAKELARQGHTVHVLSLQPFVDKTHIRDASSVPEVDGVYEGIQYHYPAGTVYWPRHKFSFIPKLVIKLKNCLGVMKFLRNHDVDVFEVYSPEFLRSLFFWLVCRLRHLLFVVERTELPDIRKRQSMYESRLYLKLYAGLIKFSFRLPDVWILETQTLVDYYHQYARRDAVFHIVPMTVDTNRFINLTREATQWGDYIGYCGNMSDDDGISILIKAYSIVKRKFPSVSLVFAGSSDQLSSYKALAESMGIDESVIFLGRMPYEKVPQFLTNAKLLALASPTSLRSCATMPSKVGEYLCTEVPVVVTGLGEINRYLTDGVSAYIAAPDSEEAFADKLLEALSDSDEKRQSIGRCGKSLALMTFSIEQQIRKFNEIFQSVKEMQIEAAR